MFLPHIYIMYSKTRKSKLAKAIQEMRQLRLDHLRKEFVISTNIDAEDWDKTRITTITVKTIDFSRSDCR